MSSIPDIPATITARRDSTHDTRVFTVLPSVSDYTFAAGQHLLLDAGMHRPRPFSFTTSPLRGPSFELAIKREGVLTGQLFTLNVGDAVVISRPLGSRLRLPPDGGPAVMVAGGTGITPFIGLVRDAVVRRLPLDLTLLFANRTEADIILQPELDVLAQAQPGLTIIYALTRHWPPDWTGEQGRPDLAMIKRHVADLARPQWLLCGPPLMVAALRRSLMAEGVAADRIAV